MYSKKKKNELLKPNFGDTVSETQPRVVWVFKPTEGE